MPITWKTKRGIFKRSKELCDLTKMEKQRKTIARAEQQIARLQNLINSKNISIKKIEETVPKGESDSTQARLLESFENQQSGQHSMSINDQTSLSQQDDIDKTQWLQEPSKHLTSHYANPNAEQAQIIQDLEIEETQQQVQNSQSHPSKNYENSNTNQSQEVSKLATIQEEQPGKLKQDETQETQKPVVFLSQLLEKKLDDEQIYLELSNYVEQLKQLQQR